MSEVIKIHDLPGLSQYGKALIEYGNNIEAASKETERQFLTKTKDSVSDAILAFFEYLNSLQAQVFHQAPSIIKQYGNFVQIFEETVTGAGFDVKAWTWNDGKDTVTQKLKVDQLDKIKEVMDGLQPLLDSASEKTSFPEVNLVTRHLETAKSNLESLALSRMATHEEIEAAHDLFSSNLSEVTANLDDLITVITHAKASMLVSPETIFSAIQSGILNRETMFYIENIENDTDGKAVEVALSGRPELLIKMDIDDISEGTYPSLASIMSYWWEREDIGVLNKYLESFTDVDSVKVGNFSQKMMIGGQKAAIILDGKMQKLFYEGERESPEFIAKQKHLDSMNGFNGLMKSVQLLEIGTSRESLKNPGGAEGQEYRYRYYKRNLNLNFEDGLGKLTLKTISFDAIQPVDNDKRDHMFELVKEAPDHPLIGMYRKEESLISGSESATFGVRGIEYNETMQAYEKERKEAIKKFIGDVIITLSDATTSTLAPELYLANKVFQSVGKLEGLKAVNNSYKFYKELDGSDPKQLKEKIKKGAVGVGSDVFSAYFDWLSKVDGIDVGEETERVKRIQDYTSQGQWYLKKGGEYISHDSTIYVDFNAGLRQRELDENGVIGFIESGYYDGEKDKENIKELIDSKIDDFNRNAKEKDKISDEVRKYAKGEKVIYKDKKDYTDKELTFDKMTPEQIKQFDNMIGTLGDKSSTKFGNYLDETFGE